MQLQSRRTGEIKEIGSSGYLSPEQRSVWKFKKRCQDFDRFIERNNLHVSFLTLTQSDLSVETGMNGVTYVMHEMGREFKKRGLLFGYVAGLEIQPSRYSERGTLAPHHHIAVAYEGDGCLPHTRYDGKGKRYHKYVKVRDGSVITFRWLESRWRKKIGQYFCCDAYSVNVTDYIGKYISKQDGLLKILKEKLGKRVRVFSSSQFPLCDQMGWYLRGQYEKEISQNPELENFYCRREGSSIVWRGKEVVEKIVLGSVVRKVNYPRVRVIHGEWGQLGCWRELKSSSESSSESSSLE